jgi:oligogalacturonide transport system permease protein
MIMTKSTVPSILKYIGLVFLAIFILFPLIWMFFGTFKGNSELFTSLNLLPERFSPDAYFNGWKSTGRITFTTFFTKSFVLVIPTTIFTVLSSLIVGYGFARFKFPMKKLLFTIMIGTMMLPNAVLIIPRYMLFHALGWLNSFNVFYIPALFGCYPFFIFMFVQFYRGIPTELDEAAKIDGCNSFRILTSILLPLMKPVIISGLVFQAAWTWEDFFNPLIFISSTEKFPVSLALRISLDAANKIEYSNVLAMATLSLLPCAILFFSAQKYFVEGITTTGIKG